MLLHSVLFQLRCAVWQSCFASPSGYGSSATLSLDRCFATSFEESKRLKDGPGEWLQWKFCFG